MNMREQPSCRPSGRYRNNQAPSSLRCLMFKTKNPHLFLITRRQKSGFPLYFTGLLCVFTIKKIAVVTTYVFSRTYDKIPDACHPARRDGSARIIPRMFFDITFVACAASPIESPARGGRYIAPEWDASLHSGVKALNCPSISAKRASPRAYYLRHRRSLPDDGACPPGIRRVVKIGFL